MNFNFMQDPQWLTLDQKTKDGVLSLAFKKNIESDPQWETLDQDLQSKVRGAYLGKAYEFEKALEIEQAPERRGFWGRMGAAAARGTVGLVESTGQALELADLAPREADTEPGVLDIAGRGLTDWSKRVLKEYDFLKQDKGELAGEPGFFERGAIGIPENIPQSVPIMGAAWGGMKLGGAVGLAVGGPAGAASGAVAGGIAGATAGLFVWFGAGTYGKEYTSAYEELARVRPEATEEERKEVAHRVALRSAALEVGTELPGTFLALRMVGGTKVLTQPLKATLKNIITKPTGELLKEFGAATVGEVGGEMFAGGGQAWARQVEGLSGPTVTEGIVESIIPSLGMSLFFGGAAAGYNAVQTRSMMNKLNSENPAVREDAADTMAFRLAANTQDNALALVWRAEAQKAIAAGDKFQFDEKIVDFAKIKAAEDYVEPSTEYLTADEYARINEAPDINSAITEFNNIIGQVAPTAEEQKIKELEAKRHDVGLTLEEFSKLPPEQAQELFKDEKVGAPTELYVGQQVDYTGKTGIEQRVILTGQFEDGAWMARSLEGKGEETLTVLPEQARPAAILEPGREIEYPTIKGTLRATLMEPIGNGERAWRAKGVNDQPITARIDKIIPLPIEGEILPEARDASTIHSNAGQILPEAPGRMAQGEQGQGALSGNAEETLRRIPDTGGENLQFQESEQPSRQVRLADLQKELDEISVIDPTLPSKPGEVRKWLSHGDQITRQKEIAYEVVQSIEAGDKILDQNGDLYGKVESIGRNSVVLSHPEQEETFSVPIKELISEFIPTTGTRLSLEPLAPAQKIEIAAHEAATSPKNELPQPTEPQKEAGNYKKGHIQFAGMDISIENPEGSTRSGVGPDGKKWENLIQEGHYGYIKGTVGKDKDHIDTFVKTTPREGAPVFVIDQVKPKTGELDEHKVMLGYDTEEEAKQAYLANYEKGWKGLGAITETTPELFKQWADKGDQKQSYAQGEGPASGVTGEQPSTRTDVVDISPKATAPEGGGLPTTLEEVTAPVVPESTPISWKESKVAGMQVLKTPLEKDTLIIQELPIKGKKFVVYKKSDGQAKNIGKFTTLEAAKAAGESIIPPAPLSQEGTPGAGGAYAISSTEAIEKAIQKYGTTTVPESASFIVPDGRIIDSSGKLLGSSSEGANIDHREIATYAVATGEAISGDEALGQFMRDTGSVRVRVTPNELNVHTLGVPNETQVIALRKLSPGKTIFADIQDAKGNVLASGEFKSFAKYQEFLTDKGEQYGRETRTVPESEGTRRNRLLREDNPRHRRAVEIQRSRISENGPGDLRGAGEKGIVYDPEGYNDPEIVRVQNLVDDYNSANKKSLEVIPIKDTTGTIDGFIQGGYIFLNTDPAPGGRTILQTLKHELSHDRGNEDIQAKIDKNSEAFKAFHRTLKSPLLYGENYSVADALEEYAADIESGVKTFSGISLADGLLTGNTIESIIKAKEVPNVRKRTVLKGPAGAGEETRKAGTGPGKRGIRYAVAAREHPFTETPAGHEVTTPAVTYPRGVGNKGNVWVRQSSSDSNEGRQLLVQFSTELINKDFAVDDSTKYYDALYGGQREGYQRLRDFWEIPQWMGYVSNFLPDADVYVVRNMVEAREFLDKAGYDRIVFSAIDVNKEMIKDISREFDGHVDIGGYTTPGTFDDINATWHENLTSLAEDVGVPFEEGVDYRHFEESKVIPRLTMSQGCLHKCAFCTVPKNLIETSTEVIDQQAEAFGVLDAKLVYLNDKTFGQAKNYTHLENVYQAILKNNPDFKGFIIQTTGTQLNKMDPEWLKRSGIKYVELGVESYNDPILRKMHKPHTEAILDKAAQRLREANISLVPNIIVGFQEETAETYQRTLDFIDRNADIISHENIYNLALYEGVELAKTLKATIVSDLDENVLEKSFHKDKAIHFEFAEKVYAKGQQGLEKGRFAIREQGGVVRDALQKNEIYTILSTAPNIESGPLDGACRVVARALKIVEPEGTIVTLESKINGKWQAEHYGLETPGGGILDGLGWTPTRDEWIIRFADEENMLLHDRPTRVVTGETPSEDIPIDHRVERELAAALGKEIAEGPQGLDTSKFSVRTAPPLTPIKTTRSKDTRELLKSNKNIFWHGSPGGDLRGADNGLHVGTYEAAKEALEARIGIPSEGEWDGSRVYGETLLAGKESLKTGKYGAYRVSGYNAEAPTNNYYPTGTAEYSDRQKIPLTVKPSIIPVRIIGPMSNTAISPLSDSKANAQMRGNITKGTAVRGFFYKNDGEDYGSISAVVPGGSHIEMIIPRDDNIIRDIRYATRDKGAVILEEGSKKKFSSISQIAAYLQRPEKIDYKTATTRENREVEKKMLDFVDTAIAKYPDAADWYRKDFGDAMKILEKVDPDIKDPSHNFMMRLAIALSSNGNTSEKTFQVAWSAYRNWTDNGTYHPTLQTERSALIDNTFRLATTLRGTFRDEQMFENWLLGEAPVSQIRLDLQYRLEIPGKAFLSGDSPDSVVTRSTIFGPKLGAFFANLSGNFNPITMDRWKMRTIGRITGDLVDTPNIPKMRERLRAVLTQEAADVVRKGGLSLQNIEEYGNKDLDNLARRIARGGWRDLGAHEEVRLAGNALGKALHGELVDAPRGPEHRAWIRERVAAVRKARPNLDPASIQAAEWIGEKELYHELGGVKETADFYSEGARILAERLRNERTGRVAGPARRVRRGAEGGLQGTLFALRGTVERIYDYAKDNPAGFTIDVATGEPVTKGWVVAPTKLTQTPVERLTPEVIRDFIVNRFGKIFETDKRAFFGGWYADDPKSESYGKFVLDIAYVVDNKADAAYIADMGDTPEEKQDGIYHIDGPDPDTNYVRTEDAIRELKESGVYDEGRRAELGRIREQLHRSIQESRDVARRYAARPAEDTGGGVPGEHEKPGAVTVIGVRYDSRPREYADSSFVGRGLQGAEKRRLVPGWQNYERTYWYANVGKGIIPERGLPAHAHKATLPNIYDIYEDVLGLVPKANKNLNTFENSVMDEGYDGVLDRRNGVVVMLGKRKIPMEYLGTNPDLSVIPVVKSITGEDFKFAIRDKEYLTVVESGDMAAAQKMVDEAAKKAGYNIETWRGDRDNWNDFRRRHEVGIFTSQDKDLADIYGEGQRGGVTRRFYVKGKILNLLDYRNQEWIRKWADAQDKEDWTDRQTGEIDEDPIGIIESGRLWDWEGTGQGTLWKDLQDSARNDGYDVLILPDAHGAIEDPVSTVVLRDNNIKLADPVTYDDEGNVIPLSERFNEKTPDIRYAIRYRDIDLPPGPTKKALIERGRKLNLVDPQIKTLGIRNLGTWPKSVEDEKGFSVLVLNPEVGKDGVSRGDHLLNDEIGNYKKLSLDKAEWLPNVPETIKNADVKLQQENGNQVYVRAYADGNHIVIVKPKGPNNAGLITQYKETDKTKLANAKVLWERGEAKYAIREKDGIRTDENGIIYEGDIPKVFYRGQKADTGKSPFWFADNEKAAKKYGKVEQANLQMRSPKVIDYHGKEDNDLYAFEIDQARAEGYDGLIAQDTTDGWNAYDQYVVFNKDQIKEVATPEDLVRYAVQGPVVFADSTTPVTQADFDENRAEAGLRGKILVPALRMTKEEFGAEVSKLMAPISTRLKYISPALSAKVRNLDFSTNKAIQGYREAVDPLLQKAKTMSRSDKLDWDYARKNSVTTKIDELVKKYGMEKEYAAVREVFDTLRDDAIDVGLDIGEINEYWTRKVKDLKGLYGEMNREELGIFSKALADKAASLGLSVDQLDPDMRATLIANIISGGPAGLGGVSAAKERKFLKIPPRLNKYYLNSDAALIEHINSMVTAIEKRRFFGKIPEKVAEMRRQLYVAQAKIREYAKDPKKRNEWIGREKELSAYIQKYALQRDYEDNIGALVFSLIDKGDITAAQQNDVNEILQARFHERGTHGFWQLYKNFSYADTMGSPISALTQIGDFAFVMYEAGLLKGIKHIATAAMGKSKITREDVGIKRIAEEFADSSKLGGAVTWIFKAVGLEKMDAIGKEALLNAAHEKYQGLARENPAKLVGEIKHIFGDETDDTVKALEQGIITDNVKMLVYSRLADFQPIGLAEMSQRYLTSGNGRVFYMLKTFTLKQFDIFRNEAIHKITTGNRSEKIEGLKNLVRLAMFFVLANATADELKDLVLGRKTDMSDRVADNILRLAGSSKFVTWVARTEGAGTALSKQVLPPFKFLDSLTKDIYNAGDDKGLELTASVPLLGKLAYWHLGRGTTKRHELWEIRYQKYKQHLHEVHDDFDKAKDKLGFMKDHQKELAEYRQANSFQGRLNNYRKIINNLKSKQEQTDTTKKRIEQLELKRTELIKQFMEKKESKNEER